MAGFESNEKRSNSIPIYSQRWTRRGVHPQQAPSARTRKGFLVDELGNANASVFGQEFQWRFGIDKGVFHHPGSSRIWGIHRSLVHAMAHGMSLNERQLCGLWLVSLHDGT